MTNSSLRAEAVVLAGLLLCLAPPVSAQPSPEQDNTMPARAWFERGLALSESQRWLEAREAYERSLDLEPHVSTYFNLAVVLLKIGEGRAALEALDAFELLANAEQHQEFVAEAAALRERALALTGTLKLTLIPDDARLRIDGADLEKPKGPIRRIRLDRGSHTIEVSAPAHVATSRVVRIEPSEAVELTIVIEPFPTASISRKETPAEPVPAPLAPLQSATRVHPNERHRRKRIWLWTGLSLVAAGVAATVVGVALARRDGQEGTAYTGSTGIVFGQN